MAKKINFIVRDRTTLELAEDAKKGDILDLASANQVDENKLEQAIEQKAWDKAEEISSKEIQKAKAEYEIEKAKLQAEIKLLNEQKASAVQNSILEEKVRLQNKQAELERQTAEKISNLQKELALAKEANKTSVQVAVAELEKKYSDQINALQLMNLEKDSKLKETEAQWQHRFLSTKSYGEELEQFIYQEFEAAQQNGAFPNAKFWKDNQVISSGEGLKGTKGDFVFKDYDDAGNEILTIEIEVKTEQSTDAKTKTHNKEHFKKLDEDRNKKGCEYAILISELEKSNKVYDGIYAVRPPFEKMYVVRPQSFLCLVSILKNSLNKNRELIVKLNQHDAKIKNKEQFIKNLKQFKDDFDISKVKWEKHLDGIEETIQDAIEELTDTLDHIRKSRDVLTTGQHKLKKLTLKRMLNNCSEEEVFDSPDDEE